MHINYGPDIRHIFLTSCESAQNRERIAMNLHLSINLAMFDHLWDNLKGTAYFF